VSFFCRKVRYTFSNTQEDSDMAGQAFREDRKCLAAAGRQNMAGMILLAVLCALAACATPAAVTEQPPAAPAEDTAAAPESGKLQEIILPQKGGMKDEQTGRRLYSLQMRDAGIQDLLFAFSEQTDMNIVVEPGITGKVTVDLKQVTMEQALETVLEPLGLVYEKQGSIIKVFRPAMETRIFTLDYITTSRTGQGLISGAIGDKGGAEAGKAADSSGGTSGGYGRVSSEDKNDIWSSLEQKIESLKSPDGALSVNKESNSILVTDYPRNLKKIGNYIAAIQGAVQRQVIIEASIVEVTLDDQYQTGINWEVIQGLPQMKNFQWGLASRGATPYLGYPGSSSSDSGTSGGTGDSNDSTIQIPGRFNLRPFSGVFSIGAEGQVIALSDIAEALSTQGSINILSNPRITTLNNQPAIIKVAREDVYFQTTRSSTVSETNTETSVKFMTIGIVLSVTPQISASGIITMNIHPSITEKAGEKLSVSGDSVPVIDVRETDTVARVRNNETVLIGGLMQDKKTESVIGVPVLKDLPYLGRLFTHVTRETKKTELVILLTPRILTEENMQAFSTTERERIEGIQSNVQ